MNKIKDRIVNYRSCIFIIFTLIIIGCTNKMDKVKELKIEANNNIYNKQNDVAKKNLEKALKINTKDPEIYYLLGNVYFNEKNYDEAIKYYTEAIEIDSTYAQAYTSRGKIYRIYNKRDEWCADFTKAYQLGDKTVYNDVRHCIPIDR
ncbi:MAG TPA: tetratricopeptide repeat protein [Bacteroidales bacterium]|nr:tetratricopeptide repeat protein [Bacteroidales bacterium]